VAALLLWLRSRGEPTHAGALQVSNPFALGTALRFALLFAAVLLASKAASTYLGTGGAYAAGVLAGATDVDAITLSMAALARGGLAERVAATTIFLGIASNTVVKGVMAVVTGGPDFGRRVAVALGAALAAGAVGLAAAWLG